MSIPWPQPEQFANTEDERQHRKQRLAAAFRLFGRFGFEEGIAGHISARDPEHVETFWVNPLAMPFSRIRVSDLIRVGHDGEVVEGDRPVNIAAFIIHSQVHDARPEVVAAAHSHSVYGRALSTLGDHLEPISQDACAFYLDHEIMDDYSGVVLDVEEGKRIASVLGESKAVILSNHGLLTVGNSVESAAWWFITMERSSQVQIIAKAAGQVKLIDDEQARLTYEKVGTEYIGWLNFQPLYDKIVHLEPDLLD